MGKIRLDTQDKVSETLLVPLYARAVEASHLNPILRDERAVQMVEQIDYDFTGHELKGHDRVTTLMRVRRFDRFVGEFLTRHPGGVVVNIGCGLDTRFARLDNQRVQWYDLDLLEVIVLRRKLVPEMERCSMVGCSVFDEGWLDIIGPPRDRQFMFIAEGVFPYFTEQQVRAIFLLLAEKFPGCELVCDGMTPAMIHLLNLQLRVMKMEARLGWGLKNGLQPEAWGCGIRLLDEWFYFDEPEPRLGAARWMGYFPFFARGVGIFHYRLGEPGIIS